MRRALVTGGAGFIGSHLVDCLVLSGWDVTVVDLFAGPSPVVKYVQGDIVSPSTWEQLAHDEPFDVVVHLAAKAGVRASLEAPLETLRSNVMGTQSVISFVRQQPNRPHVVFASSSSVYGVNPDVPWTENAALMPFSPYAASKVAGEALGQACSWNYGIRFSALRFFTVFGPRQRKDLAIHRFAERLLRNEKVPLYGDGSSERDYTYVADVVDAILKVIDHQSWRLFNVWNIGRGAPVRLDHLLDQVSEAFQISARIDWQPDQTGDVPRTWANTSKAREDLGWQATTSLEDGLKAFADWFLLEKAA